MHAFPLNTVPKIDEPRTATGDTAFLASTYRWMAAGLSTTGLLAWLTASSPSVQQMVLGNPLLLIGAFIAEFLLVLVLSARAPRMGHGSALAAFFAYAALNGVTMSTLFLVYTVASVAQVFFVCAALFAALALYGLTTKRDLTAMGQVMFFGLVGLVLTSIVNLFPRNTTIDWITTYAGVLIFAGLTAYDNQKLRQMYAVRGNAQNASLQGALTLYLDFVNLFLQLLRSFGRRR